MFFFFQAEDGIRDQPRSRGLGDVYKRQPAHYITREECQEMIDDAIRKHNRNASIISMCVGWVVLALFAEGLLRLIGVVPPLLPWLKITL